MTRPEAEKELAALEPQERKLWAEMEADRTAAEILHKEWMARNEKLGEQWQPLFTRVQKLKAFLEIA